MEKGKINGTNMEFHKNTQAYTNSALAKQRFLGSITLIRNLI